MAREKCLQPPLTHPCRWAPPLETNLFSAIRRFQGREKVMSKVVSKLLKSSCYVVFIKDKPVLHIF